MSAWREREREREDLGGRDLFWGFAVFSRSSRGSPSASMGMVCRAPSSAAPRRAFGGRDARARVNCAAGAGTGVTAAGNSAARGGGRGGGQGGGWRPRRTWLSVMGKAERTRRGFLKLSEGLHARSAWAGRESAGAAAEQATDADGCTALSGRGRRAVGVEQWLLLGAVRR